MAIFRMLKYHNQQYPSNIPLEIEEIAGHFDVRSIDPTMSYSIHTEYSYGKRKFSNPSLTDLDTISTANKNGVPQLWNSETWAIEFAEYIIRITKGFVDPNVIEIHPPFDDYIYNINEFINIYRLFEIIIKNRFPSTDIQIENRCGSVYSGGKFLIATMPQIIDLCENIEKEQLELKIALDIPQLYTAHDALPRRKDLIKDMLIDAKQCRSYIKGVHLWGKGIAASGRKVAHYGDLNSYFNYDIALKNDFLRAFNELFNDDICRNLVLEVNSSSYDLASIINDLNSIEVKYI